MRYIHNSYVNYALDLNLIALSTYNLNTSWLPALGNVIFLKQIFAREAKLREQTR